MMSFIRSFLGLLLLFALIVTALPLVGFWLSDLHWVFELAAQFMAFMVSDAFQAIIPETNWMYPAVMPEGGLAEGFQGLIRPETSLLLPADQAQALRDPALAEWRDALAQ